jgi:hypothetical protein
LQSGIDDSEKSFDFCGNGAADAFWVKYSAVQLSTAKSIHDQDEKNE